MVVQESWLSCLKRAKWVQLLEDHLILDFNEALCYSLHVTQLGDKHVTMLKISQHRTPSLNIIFVKMVKDL